MTSISDFVKNNFLSLIVLILLIIILLQRCDSNKTPDVPTIIRDTVWVHNDTTVISKPQIIKTIPVDVSRDTIINHYIPDTNYQKLVLQYQDVVNQLLAKNIQVDSVRIDTNGYVKIIDTVQKNLIVGRTTKVDVKYPVIKETIIQPAPKVNQVYAGGQISGQTGGQVINGINAGLLLKNKRDQIYGVNVGLNSNGQISYGLQSYLKIKLK